MIPNTAQSAGATLDRKNLIRQIAERHEANNRVAKNFNPQFTNSGSSNMECFFTSEYDSALKQEHEKLVGPSIVTAIPHDPDAAISDDIN